MNPKQLSWSESDTPDSLRKALALLSDFYPLQKNGDGARLSWIKSSDTNALNVSKTPDGFSIEYGSLPAALRGVSFAMADMETTDARVFESLGIMLDCSRNAVIKVSHLKSWIRNLALLGYDRIMLYTEDTYELPGEPFFGYMRGAYTAAEIRELDDYCHTLGIEMMACIQTLGHMEQILKWRRYAPVKDTDNVLLAGVEETETLIRKMLEFWGSNLRSRRIHIGMDEAHSLGRGAYIDRHGYAAQFDIFNRHLRRVCDICSDAGLKPMIWSDMYFRMGSAKRNYYDPDSVIPPEVKAEIPSTVELIYWDYYHRDAEFYRDWIQRHRDLGFEPIMASAVWSWHMFWYNHGITTATAGPCIEACGKEGVREMIFTLWGDGGAYCDFDSALAGLTWTADKSWGGSGDARAAAMFAVVCGGDYSGAVLGGNLDVVFEDIEGIVRLNTPAATAIWDDPLLGIGRHAYLFAGESHWDRVLARLEKTLSELEPLRGDRRVGDHDYIYSVCRVLTLKIKFRGKLEKAYAAKDHALLNELAETDIPAILEALDALQADFRRQWLRRNKPFGMEVIQGRLAAQQVRFKEASLRLRELVDGRINRIDELEIDPSELGDNTASWYHLLSTGCGRI